MFYIVIVIPKNISISDFLYKWMKQIKLGCLEQGRYSPKSAWALMAVWCLGYWVR